MQYAVLHITWTTTNTYTISCKGAFKLYKLEPLEEVWNALARSQRYERRELRKDEVREIKAQL